MIRIISEIRDASHYSAEWNENSFPFLGKEKGGGVKYVKNSFWSKNKLCKVPSKLACISRMHNEFKVEAQDSEFGNSSIPQSWLTRQSIFFSGHVYTQFETFNVSIAYLH